MTPQEQDFLTAGPRWSDLPRQSEGPADCRERCQLSGVQVGCCSALQDMAPLSPKGKTGDMCQDLWVPTWVDQSP